MVIKLPTGSLSTSVITQPELLRTHCRQDWENLVVLQDNSAVPGGANPAVYRSFLPCSRTLCPRSDVSLPGSSRATRSIPATLSHVIQEMFLLVWLCGMVMFRQAFERSMDALHKLVGYVQVRSATSRHTH